MRKLFNFILIIIFLVGAVTVYGYLVEFNQRTGVADPAVELVRSIVVPATPEILPDPVTIVREVRSLARLETASYEGEKVITAGEATLFSGESMIFVAYGEVIAGIDLAKMQEGDIQVVDPTTVMVNLPDAEILVATLNNERSYVADRDTGLFTDAFGAEDQNLEQRVRIAGEDAIEASAIEYGILQTAQENAENYMRTFLEGLGFTTVTFTDGPPPVPEPYEQEVPKGYELGE